MTASNFNLADYLSRIGYEGDVRADIATLTRLMQQQLRSIPFENTKVQTPHGCKILVDEADRGGEDEKACFYCGRKNHIWLHSA